MKKTRLIVISALFAAITAVLTQIVLPLPFTPVPINLALVGVLLSGALLDGKNAALSQTLYLVMGAIGVPVFSGFAGGLSIIAGPTGGYLIAYPFCAFICGKYINRRGKGFLNYFIASSISVVICYFIAALWIMLSLNITITSALIVGVYPFVLGDLLKIFIVAFVSQTINKRKSFII